MTHDELLAKIDIWKFKTQGFDDTYEVHGILNALRAVVELTAKDVKHESYLWLDGFDYAMALVRLAIEKELG